jgi:hypothetical protein
VENSDLRRKTPPIFQEPSGIKGFPDRAAGRQLWETGVSQEKSSSLEEPDVGLRRSWDLPHGVLGEDEDSGGGEEAFPI